MIRERVTSPPRPYVSTKATRCIYSVNTLAIFLEGVERRLGVTNPPTALLKTNVSGLDEGRRSSLSARCRLDCF